MAGKSLPVTFAGGTWPNRREFARAFGISPEAFTQLVSKAERRKQPLAAEDIYAAVVAARAWHGPGADEDAVWASVLELIGSRARPELRKNRWEREDDLIRAACGGPPSPEGEGKGGNGGRVDVSGGGRGGGGVLQETLSGHEQRGEYHEGLEGRGCGRGPVAVPGR